MYSYGPPHMAGQKHDDQLEHTYIQQLCEDTGCSPEDLPEAMNDRSGERGSGISVLVARHDDDDNHCTKCTSSLNKEMLHYLRQNYLINRLDPTRYHQKNKCMKINNLKNERYMKEIQSKMTYTDLVLNIEFPVIYQDVRQISSCKLFIYL